MSNCIKLILAFCLVMPIIGGNGVVAIADDIVSKNTKPDIQEQYDIEYVSYEEDNYGNNIKSVKEEKRKKTKEITRSQVKTKKDKKNQNLKFEVKTRLSVGAGLGVLGHGGLNKFGGSIFAGIQVFFKRADGVALFVSPEIAFDFTKLKSEDIDYISTLTINGKTFSSSENFKTIGGGFDLKKANEALKDYTKYSEEDFSRAIVKTSEVYVQELTNKIDELTIEINDLSSKLGEKNGNKASTSGEEGTLYDRQRYFVQQINIRNTLLDNFKKSLDSSGQDEMNKNENGYNKESSVGYELWKQYNFVTKEGYKKASEAGTELGTAWQNYQNAIVRLNNFLEEKTTINGTEKLNKEWLKEKDTSDQFLILVGKNATLNNDVDSLKQTYETVLNKENENLKKIQEGISTKIEELIKGKNDNANKINEQEELITSKEEEIESNESIITDTYGLQKITEYNFSSISFTSNVIAVFSYSTKIGFEVWKFSPYVKLSFGGMLTSNRMEKSEVSFKEVLLDAENKKYGLYYDIEEKQPSPKTKKHISLMYGVGGGIAFKLNDNFSFFVEFDYKSTKYNISFGNGIEHTFSHGIKTIFAGINFLF